MNKYKINSMPIHVKEKEQTVRANYVVVLSMQNAYLYFELNRLLSYQQIFLEKSEKNKAGKCWFLAWFGKFKMHFCKIIDVWTLLLQKKDVWMESINGIEGMNIVYICRGL